MTISVASSLKNLRLQSLTKIQLAMASLKDYGIRFISHGAWSDPEIEWKKSNFQTLLFNYWDVAECTDYESLCESTDERDLKLLVAQLYELTPREYARPLIDYEWEISDGKVYDFYDDADYYKDARLSRKDDYVLHTTGQALRQAMFAIDDVSETSCMIKIFRNEFGGARTLVASYSLQGSTLKDCMNYKK